MKLIFTCAFVAIISLSGYWLYFLNVQNSTQIAVVSIEQPVAMVDLDFVREDENVPSNSELDVAKKSFESSGQSTEADKLETEQMLEVGEIPVLSVWDGQKLEDGNAIPDLPKEIQMRAIGEFADQVNLPDESCNSACASEELVHQFAEGDQAEEVNFLNSMLLGEGDPSPEAVPEDSHPSTVTGAQLEAPPED